MTSTSTGLSVALRERTAAAHEAAENSRFVTDLSGGRLPVGAYTALVAQNHAIYRALESLAGRWRDDPVAGGFVVDALLRVPQLELDLVALLGADGPQRAAGLVTPATARYARHIDERCGDSPTAYVAHHYVRYLGDLSGGQILRAAVRRHYGAAVEDATHFYTFTEIPKIKPFRDEYRRRLDHLPAPDHDDVVEEAVLAFRFNQDVFADLARAWS